MHAHAHAPARELEEPSKVLSFLAALADYAAAFTISGESTLAPARRCLIEALARGFESLRDPRLARRIAPIVPGAVMPGGSRVPGTSLELDPVQAAFCFSLMLTRSAGGDARLTPDGARAVGSLGPILTLADYQARKATMEGKPPPKVRDVLAALLKALEIQGAILALDGEPSPALATQLHCACAAATAIATAQLGGTRAQIVRAVSWVGNDGAPHVDPESRHAGERREWAWAETQRRAVLHACRAAGSSHASFLTAADLDLADAAGGVFGTRYVLPQKKPFGTAIIDRLAGEPQAKDAARVSARFGAAVDRHFPTRQAERLKALFATPQRLDDLPVNELIAALVTNGAR